jgi:hypothetical protein
MLQLAMFWLIQSCSKAGTYVRLDVLGTLLLGAKEDKTVREAFSMLHEQLGSILLYYSGLLALGALSGWGTRVLVRWRKWDRRYEWLRYDNQWHYLLTGEVLETPESRAVIELQDASRIDFVFVDVLMKLEKSNMLYSGVLAGYELASDGGLRTIYLRGTRRKQLVGDVSATEQETADTEVAPPAADPDSKINVEDNYYVVEGDLMVIPYSQLLNLNLTYYIDEVDAQKENDASDSVGQEFEVSAVDAATP